MGNPNGRPTHGLCKLPEYSVYKAARKRCHNSKASNYCRYGGIEFRFESFPEFLVAVGRRPLEGNYTLDRINNEEHYEKGNVRWATKREQSLNRDYSIHGERNPNAKLTGEQVGKIRKRYSGGMPYKALAKEYGVSDSCIQFVIHRRSWKEVPALSEAA